MLHVCIDARLYNATGIGTFLKAALISIREAGRCKLSLICLKKDKEQLEPLSCRLIEMDTPVYTVSEQLQYRKTIPPCDLFWSPHFNVPLFPIRAKKRLVTVHDVYHLAHFSSLSSLQKVYAQVMYNAAFRLSDQVTTVSEFSKQEILRYAAFKPKNIRVVSPGLAHFISQAKSGVLRNHILCVGNRKPHKNLVRLMQAYDLLCPSVPLIIVGDFDKEVFKKMEKSPFLKQNVHFTGHVSDERLKELYAAAKMLVFPSTYEGFGYPPLEAMAYGCPVVAARAASVPEVCQDAVEYVDPFSIESIAAGMERILKDPLRQEELSRKGRELFETRKSQNNLMEEVIHACCGHP